MQRAEEICHMNIEGKPLLNEIVVGPNLNQGQKLEIRKLVEK